MNNVLVVKNKVLPGLGPGFGFVGFPVTLIIVSRSFPPPGTSISSGSSKSESSSSVSLSDASFPVLSLPGLLEELFLLFIEICLTCTVSSPSSSSSTSESKSSSYDGRCDYGN